MDRHYTPAALAERILNAQLDFTPRLVADFAAGEGALLRAANMKWPNARLIGTDINSDALNAIARTTPNVITGRCDFMRSSSRMRSRVLSKFGGKVCLALINPPFSCRGSTKHSVVLPAGQKVSCSLAMAFLLNAIQYLRVNGQVIAILPSSCLTSEKDAAAIRTISERFSITKLTAVEPYTFKNCRVDIDVVWLKPHQRKQHRRQSPRLREAQTELVRITRGQIRMRPRYPRGRLGMPSLVHTTDLQNGQIIFSGRRISANKSVVHGPVILLPRVGRPDRRKVCLYLGERPIAISDCIIALQTSSSSSAAVLHHLILERWDSIESEYVGSCAKYLTLNRINQAIHSIIGDSLVFKKHQRPDFDMSLHWVGDRNQRVMQNPTIATKCRIRGGEHDTYA